MTPLFADMGIPMLFPQVILMALAFLPVVLIEAAVVWKPMRISFPKALLDVGIANLFTTILGVPVAWGVMFVLELCTGGGVAWGLESPAKMLAAVTLQAAWLVPYEHHMSWMIPAAATFLLVPCFLVSVAIEWGVLRGRWSGHDRAAVFSAVLRANIWSYLFLLVAGSLWTVTNL